MLTGVATGLSTVGLSWGHHEGRTLPQSVDQEATGSVAVIRRE